MIPNDFKLFQSIPNETFLPKTFKKNDMFIQPDESAS